MSYTIYDTQGVITDSWPYKEASRRLSVYSRDLGRILIRARAVRKLDSKLQPATQPFTHSQFELVYGQSGWRLVGASHERNFWLSAPTDQRPAVSRVCRLLTRLIPGQLADHDLYKTVAAGLRALSQPTDKPDLIEKLLVFRLVAQLGYAPDPSANQLQPFVRSADYTPAVLEEFADRKDLAVNQINQALANTQM